MKFEGIIPALVTPFDKDDEVNYPAIGKLVDRLIGQGIGGLFVCGGTGEWWSLTAEERMKVLDKVLETAAGRTKVMAHVGAASTRMSLQLARHAEKAGASAISALPPVGGNFAPAAMWAHFKAIGDGCALPLYLYHLPQVYGDLISVDKFLEAMDTMPTLAGAKFSSYRIDDLINLKLQARGRLNLLSGCSEQLLSATVCGAEGSICTWYNVFPRLANEIFTCAKAGKVAEASRHEDLVVKFSMLCIKKVFGNLKWIIRLRGIDVGRPRPPTPDVTREECEELLPKLRASGIFDWCI